MPDDDYFKSIAELFELDEEAWARHANPWSVWTRVTTWPALMLALWSFHWFGAWSLLPLGVTIGWLVLNPYAFPPPTSTRSWASRAVMGERVYLLRETHPIPFEHANAVRLVSLGPAIGGLVFAAGLLSAEPAAGLVGAAVLVISKLWLLDRMAWLYDAMKDEVPEYADWLR